MADQTLRGLPDNYRLEEVRGGWRLVHGDHETVAKISAHEIFHQNAPQTKYFGIDSFGDDRVFEQGDYLNFNLKFLDLESACRAAVRMHKIILKRQIHPDVA